MQNLQTQQLLRIIIVTLRFNQYLTTQTWYIIITPLIKQQLKTSVLNSKNSIASTSPTSSLDKRFGNQNADDNELGNNFNDNNLEGTYMAILDIQQFLSFSFGEISTQNCCENLPKENKNRTNQEVDQLIEEEQ